MSNTTPEVNITYEVYHDGYRMVGTAEAELPQLQAMTAEVKGAGINGTVDAPVLGHFQDMTMKLNFRTTTADHKRILSQQYHHIELWAAIQYLNVSTGKYEVGQQKVITRAMPKNFNLGKLAVAEQQGVEMEFTVIYTKLIFNGEDLFEIDKYNGIYNVGGENILSDVWSAIGLQ